MQSWLLQAAATKAPGARTWKLDVHPFHLGLGYFGSGGRLGGIWKFLSEFGCSLFPSISFSSYLEHIISQNLNFPYL